MSEFEDENAQSDVESMDSDEAEAPDTKQPKELSKKAKRNRTKTAKALGMRRHAAAIGICKRNHESFAKDIAKSIFSNSEVKKLAKQVPENCVEVVTPMPLFEESCQLQYELLGEKATVMLKKIIEPVARSLAMSATRKMFDSNVKTLQPWHIRQAALPIQTIVRNTDLFSPLAVVRHAQNFTYKAKNEKDETVEVPIVAKGDDDDAEIAKEKKLAKVRKMRFKDIRDEADAAKAARKAARVGKDDATVAVEVS